MKTTLLAFALLFVSTFAKANIDTVYVWNGYYKFQIESGANSDSTNTIIELGDTLLWVELDPATMAHTITSTNIPAGAASFDAPFARPNDTMFMYIPTEVGVYEYECTPHIQYNMIGSFRVIPPTGIEEGSEPTFSVYPNPTTDQLFIKGIENGQPIEIYSSTGKLVKREDYNGSVDMSGLAEGMYFVRFRSGRSTRVRSLVVVVSGEE